MAKNSSLIGNYVHLTGRGYRLYGFYRRKFKGSNEKKNKRSPKMNEKAAVKSTKKEVLKRVKDNKVTKKDITEMENIINDFFQRHRNGTTNKEDEYIEKLMQEKLTDDFGSRIANAYKTDLGTGLVTKKKENLLMKSMELLKRTIYRQQYENKKSYRLNPLDVIKKVEEMNNQLEEIKKIIDDQTLGKMTGGKSFDDIEKQLKELKKKADDFRKQAKISMKDSSDVVAQKLSKNSIFNEKAERNIKDEVNTLIKMLFKLGNLSKMRGEVFEDIFAILFPVVAGDIALDESNKGIEENLRKLKSIKVGGDLEPVEINTDFFGLGTHRASIQLNDIDEFGHFNLGISADETEGKIDVAFNWNNSTVKASLKNYYLQSTKHIRLVTGTNFMFMVQDVLPDFVNHYLNINTQHNVKKEGKNGFFPKGFGGDNNLGSNPDQLKARSRFAMRQIIAMKALTGATYGRKATNLLVINDSSTGKTRIYSMANLVEQISKMEEKQIEDDLSVTLNGKSIAAYRLFKNSAGKDKQGVERIKSLLLELHATKVNSSLNTAFLDRIKQ